MGQQTRRNKTTNEPPSKPTKIAKYDLAKKGQRPLNINGLASPFLDYGMAVI